MVFQIYFFALDRHLTLSLSHRVGSGLLTQLSTTSSLSERELLDQWPWILRIPALDPVHLQFRAHTPLVVENPSLSWAQLTTTATLWVAFSQTFFARSSATPYLKRSKLFVARASSSDARRLKTRQSSRLSSKRCWSRQIFP